MAETQEITINGISMRVTLEILDVDKATVTKELKSRNIPTTQENIDKVIETIKGYEVTDMSGYLDEFINGDQFDLIGSESVYSSAIGEHDFEEDGYCDECDCSLEFCECKN